MRERWFPPDEVPADYAPTMEIAAVVCQHGQHFLFLQRGAQVSHPLTWNIPGGKLEPGESARNAAIREIQEEAGFLLDEIDPLGTVSVRCYCDFLFHLFHSKLPEKPKVIHHAVECHSHRWVTLEEAMKLPLIHGDIEMVELVRSILH